MLEGLKRHVGIARPRATGTEFTLSSWMKLYFGTVRRAVPTDLEALASAVRAGGYSCVGQSHSYNGIQVVPGTDALLLGECGFKNIFYDAALQQVTLGCSVTVREAKEALAKHDRRLLNSGNYMAQTVIGALLTGTHGYGERATMADGIVALTFLDGEGNQVTLCRGDTFFAYVALSFGAIAPIVSVTLETAPFSRYRSDAWITRLSQKAGLARDAVAVSYAALPYSDPADPVVMLHTLSAVADDVPDPVPKVMWFSLKQFATFIIRQYWAIDRTFPGWRRATQRLVARIGMGFHRSTITDRRDLDYLYDPAPGLAESRAPELLQGFFSTTHTSYNLAFFVPLEKGPEVVRYIMRKLEELHPLGFCIKSLIGVRELKDRSPLPFAGNFRWPAAAIDLFADIRDYAWLERLQREVIDHYPDARPHWGKSALVPEFAEGLGAEHIERLREIYRHHYPRDNVRHNGRVRRLFDLGPLAPGSSIGKARADTAALDIGNAPQQARL